MQQLVIVWNSLPQDTVTVTSLHELRIYSSKCREGKPPKTGKCKGIKEL